MQNPERLAGVGDLSNGLPQVYPRQIVLPDEKQIRYKLAAKPGDAMASANELEVLLAEKDALERQAIEAVDDASKATALLRQLQHLNRTSVGTLAFRWPRHPHLLYLRCGSSDLFNFMQIFIGKEYDIRLPYTPARIIDLGGYVGFAAAYLANKFPDASIISVEPSPDSYRVNILNTAPFNNVRRLNAAV